MSGDTDKLARIEADARKTLAEKQPSMYRLWKPWAFDRADDVLVLVEIAKAARRLVDEAGAWEDGYTDALRAALSALDGDT